MRRVNDRCARKNEFEFWSNREIGMQDWNVELPRKVEKNEGHEELVKLLPTDVSKGVGRGVVMTVTEGAVDVETPGVDPRVPVAVLITDGSG